AVDLGPQAGAEAALCVQLDAVLLGQRDSQRRPGDEAALDEDRPQQAPRFLLLLQGTVELVFGDEALGDEQRTKRPPGLLRSFHAPYIGAKPSLHKGQYGRGSMAPASGLRKEQDPKERLGEQRDRSGPEDPLHTPEPTIVRSVLI